MAAFVRPASERTHRSRSSDGKLLRTYPDNHKTFPGFNFGFDTNSGKILQDGTYDAPDGINIGERTEGENGQRSGDHKPHGFFWALGKGIQAGCRVTGVSVMDFAPTVGAVLDVRLNDVDGRMIPAITLRA